MADAMETLKNILGDGAEDKIKSVMDSLGGPDDTDMQTILPEGNGGALEQVTQLKGIVDSLSANRSDPRTNLLLSLKPYMRTGRQNSIDAAVRLLGLANITKLLRK